MLEKDYYYSRAGDDGMSSLIGGRRLSKGALRFQAIGTLEEVSSTIGLARLIVRDVDTKIDAILNMIQKDLIDVISDLSAPIAKEIDYESIRVSAEHTDKLEICIDQLTARSSAAYFHVLDSHNAASVYLHHTKVVARRAERTVVALSHSQGELVGHAVLSYLNRLSSFLFAAEVFLNNAGKAEEKKS